ncbi:MAG: GDSL-type esterase/lipase family protein [Candidatus Dormibacteria bacterium]
MVASMCLLGNAAGGAPAPVAVAGEPSPSYRTAWTAAMSTGGTATGSNFTCRFVARSTVSGDAVRIRLSNSMGDRELTLSRVTVAHRSDGSGVAAPPVPLTFGGDAVARIAPGHELLSDGIAFGVSQGEDLAVSIYVAEADPPLSVHGYALETGGCTDRDGSAGDHTDDMSGAAFTFSRALDWWLDAIAVRSSAARGTVVVMGDSISDGFCTAIDGHQRWTDVLARRLAGSVGVANQGIAGNTLAEGGVGPVALSRLRRDVLALPGATTLLLYEGVNDLLAGADAGTVLSGMRSIVTIARSEGLRVIGATLTPFGAGGARRSDAEDARRQVNRAIRAGGVFGEYVDFERALAGPDGLMRPMYECDFVHPNAAGLATLAEAVPLGLLP